MPQRLRRPPAWRLHKPTGQAVVRLDGKDRYLGKHNSEASHEAYRRLIAEWLTSPGPRVTSRDEPCCNFTLDALILIHWDRHVVSYYTKNGRPTSEQDNVRQALRFARSLYGNSPVTSFTRLALKSVRDSMIAAGRCRSLINKDCNRIRGMFRWAVEHELIPVANYHAL